MKYIELFAGIGGFRYGLENVADSKREQSRVSKKGTALASDQHITLGTQQFTCVYSNEWDKYAAQIYRRHYGEIDTRDIRDVSGDTIPEHDLLTAGFPCQDFSVAGKGVGLEGTRGTLFFEIARILSISKPGHFLLENVKGLLSNQDGKTFITILRVLSDLGYGVEWMVLNSKHFGVPQNRERVFIIGHLRGKCSGQVFPIGGTNTANSPMELQQQAQTSISPTLRTPGGGHHIPTINENARIRRLIPIECERLQGFPDGWTEGVSDTQRYKCLGNAVTTSVITAIGEGLLEHLVSQ